ncbi:hybrid sensor histidine kinase/response regulator [Chroogloeocystis siderophila]|jgi:PAS domain S-box-containing protein|uniref:histidine kinase n=1 Tax=Chroogloeocystis siderophila 5.2 s.c.1 TaxID=247279 RepID=A0A1U7HS50_9CHRO|nr:hybrid sensor histidine kinase/response regulator [Chroogloeocystis siderophila]OKH26430.1 hybrid sensor histidine kinase/response regulator [Chroogloeocystis siderophila 5.2 s.c.1]
MSKASILIVEDELLVAKDIQNRLTKFGYAVVGVVSSGKDAINKAIEKNPDLILMDIHLKGDLDGIEVAQVIYDDLNIPIVYLTANADDNTLERAKATEPFGYILKPFKEKELKTTIEITLTKHQIEKKLRQSEQWLATVLKSIGDAVITSDACGIVTFMNPVAESLTGWTQEEAYGRDATEIFNITHSISGQKVDSPIVQALKQGITVGIAEETLLITKNGIEIPIDDSAAPIRDDKGNITGAVLVFRDITERKQAKEARQKQIEQERLVAQLEKLNQLKDDFLSTVSHELRTPIANMKMAIQMLSLAPNIEKSRRYLEILQAECTRETELINDLLDLQRLELATYPTLLAEAIHLSDWLAKIIEPFVHRSEQRQQILQMNIISPNLIPLVSGRASIERILAELLNNACKYTPAGGKIILSVSQDDARSPEDAARNTDLSRVKTIFSVKNQAEIPQEQLPRIFEKFYRVPQSDRWQQGGTGLGLALVQKLVEHLQGTIDVTSDQGWTTFTVTLTNLVGNHEILRID